MSLGVRKITIMVLIISVCGLMSVQSSGATTDSTTLEQDFSAPPQAARLKAYWWWLNSNVTKEAITRDLEELKAKGFGGAVIFDADGSSQGGHDRAPCGPTFFSPEWREMYKHALREAYRLGLEISLNIQSGWNLGGPMVKPEDAPKKLVWTEMRVKGGMSFDGALPHAKGRDGFYRDLFVLAYQEKKATSFISTSSHQIGHPPYSVADGDLSTYWVSDGTRPGGGPTIERPQWFIVEFPTSVVISQATVSGRPGYGPRSCELHVSSDGQNFNIVKTFKVDDSKPATVEFDPVEVRKVRLVMTSSYDVKFPDQPRNVQVAEFKLTGPNFTWPDARSSRRAIKNQGQKALLRSLVPFSAPDSTPLFQEFLPIDGEEDVHAVDVLDLTELLELDGKLAWEIPEGCWTILRFGYALNDHCHVSTSSEGWGGYALDPFDRGACERYWDEVVEPLVSDAGEFAGKSLKYLHTDSWEVEVANWTPTLRENFKKRRGYDLLPWLPVIAGKIVNSRSDSNRFLHDFRRTMGDLAIANHYKPFRDRAHKHRLLIHPESGGPHAVPIDAQQCLGFNDAPMGEFWARSWRHRIGDSNRFFVKQPASAAHTYGRKLVLGEGFTTIGPHWQETLWDNLKPSFDKALCEGLNLLVWHTFVCSPKEQGIPGQQYFAGTHLNPNVTWWELSEPFFAYINRCQALLQRGLPFADVLYYYGDHVPNFTQHKWSDPAKILPGFDYDVISEEALLERVSVSEGRIMLPDGVSYSVLALADRTVISLPVLRKVNELVAAGATVVGKKPVQASGLKDAVQADAEVQRLANALWDSGKIVCGRSAHEALNALGVKPDCEFKVPPNLVKAFDFIHRKDGDTDIYFVANRSTNEVSAHCVFRVAGKVPELWDAVSGTSRRAQRWVEKEGRISVPIEFTPCGSQFVIFRERDVSQDVAMIREKADKWSLKSQVDGPWEVTFDPKWLEGEDDAGRHKRGVYTFERLQDWSQHSETGIKYYSGTAVYRKTVTLPEPISATPNERIYLDLGVVCELAEVRVNGKVCGTLWSPPFRVEITDAIRAGANSVEVRVVNFWYNRVFRDHSLPPDKRLTRTNIKKFHNPGTPLMPSGLLGPVRVLSREVQ